MFNNWKCWWQNILSWPQLAYLFVPVTKPNIEDEIVKNNLSTTKIFVKTYPSPSGGGNKCLYNMRALCLSDQLTKQRISL